MNYCFVCGRWQKIIAWFRCSDCWEKWMEGKEAK